MNVLVAGLEQTRDRVLRQPVHFQVRMELSKLARDGDVATTMAETDWGGKIECALLASNAWQGGPRRRDDAEAAIDEVVDQRVGLCRVSSERVMTAAGDSDELRAAHLGVR